MGKKAIAPILSGVLYISIIAIAVVFLIYLENPELSKMEDMSYIKQAVNSLKIIDDAIQKTSSEGLGSKRIVPVEIKKGILHIDSEKNQIYFLIKTDADIISNKREINDFLYDFENSSSSLIIKKEYLNTGIKLSKDLVLYNGMHYIVINNEYYTNGTAAITIAKNK